MAKPSGALLRIADYENAKKPSLNDWVFYGCLYGLVEITLE